jgi:hypothetical protein
VLLGRVKLNNGVTHTITEFNFSACLERDKPKTWLGVRGENCDHAITPQDDRYTKAPTSIAISAAMQYFVVCAISIT